MKILVYIHGYPPTHNAGAEWMLYDMVEYLKQFHEITVITYKAVPGSQQGVSIKEITPLDKHIFDQFDAVISHLDLSAKVYNIMNWLGRLDKFYLVVHNTNLYGYARRPQQFNVIYNSKYTSNMLYPQRSAIVRPPLVAERYRSANRKPEAITLVNCWENKGGKILAEVARKMPEQKFIGVLGGYGEQVQVHLDNLEYVKNNDHISDVYARTKIYIQPSFYESWGKAACEALSCGIPVICTATPGLVESMGYAATYVQRDADAYVYAIQNILSDYDKYCDLANMRTKELIDITTADLDTLDKFLHRV